MRTERKVYTEEFKRDAVRLAKERGNTLQGWKLQLDKTPDNPFPGNGNPRDADFAQLQRENARLREENEILKKALGIFTVRPQQDTSSSNNALGSFAVRLYIGSCKSHAAGTPIGINASRADALRRSSNS